MKKITITKSIEFSPNKRKVIELEPNSYISHIDATLVARIKSSHSSMPERRENRHPFSEEKTLETIPSARKTAFPRLIEHIDIFDSHNLLIPMRYSGRNWFFQSWVAKCGRIRKGKLPMEGRTRKIRTDFVIHFGDFAHTLSFYKWDMTILLSTSKHNELVVNWSDSSALGSGYEVEWARLDFTFYVIKVKKDELEDIFPLGLVLFPEIPEEE